MLKNRKCGRGAKRVYYTCTFVHLFEWFLFVSGQCLHLSRLYFGCSCVVGSHNGAAQFLCRCVCPNGNSQAMPAKPSVSKVQDAILLLKVCINCYNLINYIPLHKASPGSAPQFPSRCCRWNHCFCKLQEGRVGSV